MVPSWVLNPAGGSSLDSKDMTKHFCRSLLLLCILLSLPSCLSYHARFEKAAAEAAVAGEPKDITGPWKGKWKSQWNGHEGPLWCIVTPTPEKPGVYDFRYRAGWGVLEFGNYVHTIPAQKNPDGSYSVKGEMALPKLFGTHSLEGKLDAQAFDASYKSDKGDHGIMILRRPDGANAAPKE